MFPEYVEKHLERQRAAEQAAAEQGKQNGVSPSSNSKSSGVQSEGAILGANGNGEVKGRQQKPLQKFPLWLTALIVAVFASIMALPLLTLDLTHTWPYDFDIYKLEPTFAVLAAFLIYLVWISRK